MDITRTIPLLDGLTNLIDGIEQDDAEAREQWLRLAEITACTGYGEYGYARALAEQMGHDIRFQAAAGA